MCAKVANRTLHTSTAEKNKSQLPWCCLLTEAWEVSTSTVTGKRWSPKMHLLTKNNTSLICLSLSPLTSNKCYIFQLIINSCCTIFVGKCTLTMGTTLSGLSFSVQFSTPQFLLVFCVLDQSGAMFFWEAEQPKHVMPIKCTCSC